MIIRLLIFSFLSLGIFAKENFPSSLFRPKKTIEILNEGFEIYMFSMSSALIVDINDSDCAKIQLNSFQADACYTLNSNNNFLEEELSILSPYAEKIIIKLRRQNSSDDLKPVGIMDLITLRFPPIDSNTLNYELYFSVLDLKIQFNREAPYEKLSIDSSNSQVTVPLLLNFESGEISDKDGNKDYLHYILGANEEELMAYAFETNMGIIQNDYIYNKSNAELDLNKFNQAVKNSFNFTLSLHTQIYINLLTTKYKWPTI